ncbi:hypothetical protein HXX76_003434 [Chlamydomonas incerta]|uniref:Uncharacterized protein n=1 Tax=Chlamydomonas incerta TaxID=51695 RepID=A0A835TD14_CHLIN|nr:hypothetical protein HXX76_003434 [Chlamydomonas incerta]|eukprot:KAG2441826.1 hypothetical protein HXX76_003434 [Chlamydomonas incerta]
MESSAAKPSAPAEEGGAPDPSRVWLPDIVSRIAAFLSPNEVAATLRLVCKTTASLTVPTGLAAPAPAPASAAGPGASARLHQHSARGANVIRLSEPVPHHAFGSRWIENGGLQRLSLRQRQRLLALTAASGDLKNLRSAAAAAGWRIGSQVAVAAAAAGRLRVLRWLRRWGVGVTGWQVLAAAAGSGRRDVFLWLVCGAIGAGACGGEPAASGGGRLGAAGCGSGGESDGEVVSADAASGEGEDDEDEDGDAEGNACGSGAGSAHAGPSGGSRHHDRVSSPAEGHRWGYEAAAAAAARAGQADMLTWMAALWRAQWREQEQQPALIRRHRLVDVMEAVAEGCSADTFARLYDEWVGPGLEEAGAGGDDGGGGAAAEERRVRRPVLRPWEAEQVVAAAAGSPLPDWEAKLTFLAAAGYRLSAAAGGRATARADWRRRLDWLERAAAAASAPLPPPPPPGAAVAAAGLGFGAAAVPAAPAAVPQPLPPLDAELARAAACVGNAEAVRYVCGERRTRLSLAQSRRAVANAVEGCHLECLEALREHWEDGSRGWLLLKAVEAGALPVLTWMEGRLGAAAVAAAVRGASAGGGSASELLAAAVTADLPWVDGSCSSSASRSSGGGGCSSGGPGGAGATGSCSSEVAILEWLKAHCGGLRGGGCSSRGGASGATAAIKPTEMATAHAGAAAADSEVVTDGGDAMDADAQFGLFVAAAAAGNGAALEWLAAEGCDMGTCGLPYARAAHNGDVATLATLRRLGCAWAPGGDTFRAAVYDGRGHCGELPALKWLRSEGCPVDWGAALAAADGAGEDALPRVRQWLEAMRRRGQV